MSLSQLNDDELLRHAWISLDPLTSTDLEQEIAKRLQARVDEESADGPLQDALDKASVERDDLVPLMALLEEFSVTDLKSLRDKLERADKWYDIAEEAGDLFQQLQDLTKATV